MPSLGFHQNLLNYLLEGEDMQMGLTVEGPGIIEELMARMSLREIARRSKISPTYLSNVRNRRQVISIRAYLKLHDVAMKDS